MNILCGNCGKDSGVERTESDGTNAALVMKVDGWVAKCPMLVGIDEFFFGCSKECMKLILEREYKSHNVSDELRAKAIAHTEEFKAKIPQMAAETAQYMGKVQGFLNKLKDKKK